jgi:hypothetical protein
MKNLRALTIAAIVILLSGLILFFLIGKRAPFKGWVKTRSTVTKFPVVTVQQKVNKKEGGPDLPSGMRSYYSVKLHGRLEGIPEKALKEGERERNSALTVEMTLGSERMVDTGVQLDDDFRFTYQTPVHKGLFEDARAVGSLVIAYPGYIPFKMTDIPLRRIDENIREAELGGIKLRKE